MTENNTENVTVREAKSEQFTVSPSNEVASSSGVLGTARTRTGNTVANRNVVGTDIVTVRGMEMTVAQAANYGFLKEENGRYMDPDASDPEPEIAKPEEPEAPDLSDALQVEPEVFESLNDISGALHEFGANPVGVIGELMGNPDELPEAIKLLSAAKGFDEVAVKRHVRAIAEQVDAAMLDHAIDNGVSPEKAAEFTDYVMNTVPRTQLVTAVAEAIYGGRMSAYNKIVGNFLVAYGRGRGSAETVIETGYDGSKSESVHVPGIGRVGREAARRMNLV